MLPRSSAVDQRIQANYGRLPLAFEANQGQTDEQVRFVARGTGYGAFLTGDGMVLSLRAHQFEAAGPTGNALPSSQPRSATMRFRLMGANRSSAAVGEFPQSGRVNYFMGNDPSKWRRNIPTYGQIRYKNIYRGIDLLYYGNQQELEYDFEIAPGADPKRIQFEVSGAEQIYLDSEGYLVLITPVGRICFQAPIVYQESGGRRVPVEGRYVVSDSNHVGFHVAHYDQGKPLVIDPILIYSTYLGGSGDDQPSGIAVDKTGNVYVAGSTTSTDFPLTNLGSLPAGSTHVFIAKLDAIGSNLIYADYLGGNSQDYGYALALDSADNVYVTGSTASSDFPTVHPFQGTYPGSFNGFVTEISPDGSSLLYSTYFGGNGSDTPSAIAVDASGEVVLAGNTSSTNLPVANAYQSTVSANGGGMYGNYGFVAKFSSGGSSLAYSTYFGGSSNVPLNCGGNPCWPQPFSSIEGLALDTAGNAYVTGTTNTYNFPVTTGAYLTTNTIQANGSVGFVSKLSASGSLQYSTYFYEASGLLTNPSAIAVDGSGSSYITGVAFSDGTFPITSTSICDPGVYNWACSYAFVTKFDTAGAHLAYSTFLGPNNSASPRAIALDPAGDAYVVASASNGLFSTVDGIQNFSGGNDLLLVEIDSAASAQLFATFLGGTGNDSPAGIAFDASGNLFAAGTTTSSDLPVTASAFQKVLGGSTDAFIVKIGTGGPAVSLGPNSLQYASLPVGSISQPQAVVVSNVGGAPLTIAAIATAGDFGETDNCAATVPAAGNCSLSVTFSPTASGTRSGAITIQDDATGSPHVISLSGIGTSANGNPVVLLVPTSIAFSGLPVGSSSAPQLLTVTNSGTAALSVAGVQATGDFTQTNNCLPTLSVGANCTVSITFTPTTTGNRLGTLTITDNAQNSPQSVSLVGTGSDFSLTSSANSVTIKAGAAATYTLTIAPVGGTFANPVQLNCSGVPAHATCDLSPASVTPGANPASTTLTINTTAASAGLSPLHPFRDPPPYAAWIQLQGLGFFGILLAGSRRANRLRVPILTLVMATMLLMSGCAGVSGGTSQHQYGTAPGHYTITVSGASGALQHSVQLTLVVQ